jgi:hypothetical protein
MHNRFSSFPYLKHQSAVALRASENNRMASPSKPYARLLSPFERMWLAAQTSCLLTIVEGDGELSASALRAAVACASQANPGSRLKLTGFGPWAKWVESDSLPTVTEVDGKNWDGCSSEGAPFSDIAHMEPQGGPSASYIIVHGALPRLIQRTHHATMDGMGALQFLQDVFRALRGEAVIGASGTETDLDLARTLNGRSRRSKNVCLNPFGSTSNRIFGSTWCRVQIAGAVPEKPLARTILAVASIARRTGFGDVLIDLPVNLRASFPDLRNTGNLTGSLRLSVPEHANIASIQEDIHAQIKANRHADAIISNAATRFLPLPMIRQLARLLAKRAVLCGEFSPSATISNLGKLDMRDFSTDDFSARSTIVVPPAFDGVPLFLTLCGNDQGLDLCARAPNALGSNGRLKNLLEAIATALLAPKSLSTENTKRKTVNHTFRA